MAQTNPTVGAMTDNAEHIIRIITEYQSKFDLIVFPELSITGYPIEDLVFHQALFTAVEAAKQAITRHIKDCHVIIGYPSMHQKICYNTAAVLSSSGCVVEYHKVHLPNYGVFDEARYFQSGQESEPCVFSINEYRLGIVICEDLWQPGPVEKLINCQVDLLVSINASPFDTDKHTQRQALLRQYAQQHISFIYVNQVGGQDELVFDGRSFAMNENGIISHEACAFAEDLYALYYVEKQFTHESGTLTPSKTPISFTTLSPPPIAYIYQALVCGLRDYVNKNGFPGVLLGLSGGIDSALTIAIAVDALGPSRVKAIMLPSRYTADISLIDALSQIQTLGVAYEEIPIDPPFQSILKTLKPVLSDQPIGTTEENLQARIRGLLLMALSNQSGYLLVNTSNKSEMAVGYATLYGDMCGGFAVLKDVYKTQVYALAHYRNQQSPVIPERVLTRQPTAELAPNQTDQDTLPEYALLDAILSDYIEKKIDIQALIQKGYPHTIVSHIVGLINKNEYKRFQAPPGTKITPLAFGKDWRYPITKRLQN